jgi:very-short-patch-repair endonuclease
MAAVLSLPAWVVSGRTAARMWKLDVTEWDGVELTGTGWPPKRKNLLLHRNPSLQRVDVTKLGRFPITTATRTLLDLGNKCDADVLEDAMESALRKRLTTYSKLREEIDRVGSRGRKGAAMLARLLERRGDVPPTESVFETRLVRYLRRHKLPSPQRQVEMRNGDVFLARVDFAYPHARLILEADGVEYHGSDKHRREDKGRRNPVIAEGWRIIAVSWDDLGTPDLAGVVRRALGYRSLLV